MRAIKIRMIGKQDINGEDYYFTTTHVPALIDLSKTVIHFYPDEEEDGTGFGGELVIRHYDPRAKSNAISKVNRRRRRRQNLVDDKEEVTELLEEDTEEQD